MIEANAVHVFDDALARRRVELAERRNAAEDAASAVVDDDYAPVDGGVELSHDPWRVAVVDCGEVTDDADVRPRRIALAEERGELAVDAVRAAVGGHFETARLARGNEIPFADRKRVAEVDAGVRRDRFR